MCQEIYFGGHRAQSPEYPDVYPDIRAVLLGFITRKSTCTRQITEAESPGSGLRWSGSRLSSVWAGNPSVRAGRSCCRSRDYPGCSSPGRLWARPGMGESVAPSFRPWHTARSGPGDLDVPAEIFSGPAVVVPAHRLVKGSRSVLPVSTHRVTTWRVAKKQNQPSRCTLIPRLSCAGLLAMSGRRTYPQKMAVGSRSISSSRSSIRGDGVIRS